MVLPMKSGGAETKFEREAGCTRLPIRAGPLFLEKGWEGRGSHMISGGKNSIWRKQRFLSAGVTDFSFFRFPLSFAVSESSWIACFSIS